MDSYFVTRRRLKVGLVIAGLCAGAVVGAALTYLGKIVAGAPPATLGNYVWNMVVFGVVSAIVTPIVTWSALRDVPLWRTVLEPLAVGIAGAVIGVFVGSGVALLVLPPVGIGAAILRLNHTHRGKAMERRAVDG
jgi:Na+/H+-dicarboxylate symporter